jgi:hypothetical protein
MRQKTWRIAMGTAFCGLLDSPAVMPTLIAIVRISIKDSLEGGDVHFSPRIQRPRNDKRPGNAVDRVRKRSGIMPVLEPDDLATNAACADADGQDEENNEREDFDSARISRSPI